MEDLIKRQDAIKALYKYSFVSKDVIEREINAIPSADRPQGEWIEHKERTIVMDGNFIDFFPTEYECSNCGLRRTTYFINSTLPNYCPNCGAKMKQ